ncbi:MAG: STAS domain-containing protein [Krumholzibacteria bacterium]|nr:STAS domain-containing protein [Candidatus Krumholzibacteria bacterium]
MLISKRAHGRVMVIHLAGKFEGGPDRDKLLATTKLVLEDGFREIVVSFLGVRFLSSNGVGIMIAMKALVDAVDARLVLCNFNERALSVVHILRLEEVIPVAKNIQAARALLRHRGGDEQAEARA